MNPAEKKRSRRWLLAGAGAVGLGAIALAAAKPRDHGGAHNAYFQKLSRALTEAGLARPTLIVDRNRLAANADAAAATLEPSRLPLRLVVKSLPAFGLLDLIATRLQTQRYMAFNGAMLRTLISARPQSDILMGKPLPIAEAAPLIGVSDAPAGSPQWLIDTPQRLAAYSAIARARNKTIRVNFEIDVGLHRGGAANVEALRAMIQSAKADPLIVIAGLMGYDPHVVKTPNPDAAFRRVQKIYAASVACITQELGVDAATLTLNTAGSPTYKLHAAGTAANEVSVGSAFVKPADFDIDSLSHHQPACFIATPVIKTADPVLIPSLESIHGLATFWDPNAARGFFIYGGHWLARPESPPGLQHSALFGRSSNQELLTGSRRVALHVDDFVFFRPTQSEAVFLQFGAIAHFDGEHIVSMMETFPVSA